jgi:hypothetical protein
MADEVEYMLMVDSAVQVLYRMCPLPWLSKSEEGKWGKSDKILAELLWQLALTVYRSRDAIA